jgi:hypothetical protein
MFDIFRTAPAQTPAAPAPAPATPGNIPNLQAPVTEQNNVTAPNGVVPAGGGSSAINSPLAAFEKLWEPNPNANNSDNAAPQNALTPELVQQVVSKVDFSGAISPEHLQAISAGGQGAQEAFSAAMSAVAQQVLTQSMLVNNKLTERAVQAAMESQQKQLPDLLRKQSIDHYAKDNNPLFNNPAIKPVIEATQYQLGQKFPNATPAEIAKMTGDYIQAMSSAFAPKPNLASNSNETDWSAFLGAN